MPKIFVVGCDAYAHLAPRFMRYFREAWPNCPYSVEFVADSEPLAVDVPVLYTERDTLDYGGKLKDYLEQCDDPLILILMIDFVITYVDDEMVRQAVALLQEDQEVGRVQLSRPANAGYSGKDYKGFGIIPCHKRYALSTHVGLWRRDFLKAFVREGENPWRTEIKGTNRMHRADCKGKKLLSTYDSAIYVLNTHRYGKRQAGDKGLEKRIKEMKKKAENCNL